MSEIELSDGFFQKTAGWEAVQHARALLASGRVLSSHWTPPVLKGVVQAGETSYRSGLVIRGIADIDNLCTCRPSREDGILCAHSVAVGLHHLKGQTPVAVGSSIQGGLVRRASPTEPTRDPVRLKRAEDGPPLSLNVILPPGLSEALSRGKVQLVFEGQSARGRTPLHSLINGGPFRLAEDDARLLDAAEALAGGDTPGILQLSTRDFLGLLPVLAGHPQLTLGRHQPLSVSTTPVSPPLRASLNADGVITLTSKPGQPAPRPLVEGQGHWVWSQPSTIAPLALPESLRGVLAKPMQIPRPQVPEFLLRHWPVLSAAGALDADFDPASFDLTPQPPRFLLNLGGGLAQLTGTLQCAYGARIMTVGVTRPDEAAWIPDPGNPKRYAARDLASEHAAFSRLRAAGFSGPNAQGQWQLLGQDRILPFFAREYRRMEREWTVSLDERLDRSTRTQMERIEPRVRITPGAGGDWFDLEVRYESAGGESFSAADIQQLLRGGGSRRLKNGRWAVLDTGAVEELQEVVLDCAPEQLAGEGAARYRMDERQAGFLHASLQEQGLAAQVPDSWRQQARQMTGEIRSSCPPLGPLETVLRPYQKDGVAWIRFLRDHGFGGVLADEMGLGKTLQVLAHLSSAIQKRRAAPNGPVPAHPTLVICPTSLVFNWAAEAGRFTPDLRVLVWSGPDRQRHADRIAQSDLVITSYALIRRDLEVHRNAGYDTVILDEAQHIKNRETQNARAVKAIRSEHRLVLTGTPLENSVLDLWSLYDFLMPGYLGSAQDFRERYEIPIVRERDAGSLSRLTRRVRPFLLRRLKRDVVKDLPKRLEQVTFCELNEEQAGVYQQLLAATRQEVLAAVGGQGLAKSRMLVLTALLRLRQVCCDLRLLEKVAGGSQPDGRAPSGKVQLFGELLDEVLDGGHRVLVFSQFTTMLELLRDELAVREVPCCYLDGSTRDRAAVVERFQRDASVPVFLISLKAGGVGLNLTGADTVIHFDPWWNPAVEDQATDRAHRIGQTRVVTSYKLITRGTIEEKILQLQRRKREVIEATLTGEEAFTQTLTWEEIQELLS